MSWFALAWCAQFVCVKAARHHLGTDEIYCSGTGCSVIIWGSCGCVRGGLLPLNLVTMNRVILTAVCGMHSRRHFPPFTRQRWRAVDAWLSVKLQWLCAVEKGDMSFKCLPVTVCSDKPQSPQSFGSLSSQGGGFFMRASQ